jgi:hypothetical protein
MFAYLRFIRRTLERMSARDERSKSNRLGVPDLSQHKIAYGAFAP